MDKKENKSTQQDEKKVIIETSSDLYKLPLDVIKNTKLYNFKGNYYDELYEEALKIEKAGGLEKFSISNYLKKGIKIEKIKFQMTYYYLFIFFFFNIFIIINFFNPNISICPFHF